MLKTAIHSLFESIGITPPKPGDHFNILYEKDVFFIFIIREGTGALEKACFRCVDNEFKFKNPIRAGSLSKQERNHIILKLRDTQFSQRQIADIVGVTQQTVSNVLRYEKNSSINAVPTQPND
jgi:hypothetical protein